MNEGDKGPDAEQIAAAKEAERIIEEHKQKTQTKLTPNNITRIPLEEAQKAIVANAEEILWGHATDSPVDTNTPTENSTYDRKQNMLGLDQLLRAQGLLETQGIKAIETLLVEKGIARSDTRKLIEKADTDFEKPGQRITIDHYLFVRANRLRGVLKGLRGTPPQNDPSATEKRRNGYNRTLAELREVENLEKSWKKNTDQQPVADYIDKRKKIAINTIKDTIAKQMTPDENYSPESVGIFTASAIDYVGLHQLNKAVQTRIHKKS